MINAMITSGSYKNSLASITLGEGKALLKERLDAIMSYKKKSQTPLGTKADYHSLLALKTSDYKNQTVAEFNNSLLEWAAKNQAEANVRVIENDMAVHQFPEYLNAEEQSFLSLTIAASINENSVQTRSCYGKPMIDPDLSFELSRQNTEVDPPIWT